MDLRKVMLVTGFVGIIGIPVILYYFNYSDFSWVGGKFNTLHFSLCMYDSNFQWFQ